MKQQLLVALASAAVGAATALFFARPDAVPARTSVLRPTLDLAGIETAFRRALRDVEVSAVLRSVPVENEATAAPGPIRGSGHAVAARAGAMLPPAKIDVLSGVRSFEDDSGLRRSWILRGEAAVLEWLGVPDNIVSDPGGEFWYYGLPDESTVRIRFHRGRVINLFRSQ